MKAYTDIEQSNKLAEILPLESADMYYPYDLDANKLLSIPIVKDDYSMPCIHCWSLAALIEVLPVDWWGYNEHYFLEISRMGDASRPNEVRYFRFRKNLDGANYDRITHISHSAKNLVDACVNMIITLYDHKLLLIK